MTKLILLILLLVSGMGRTWAQPVAADDINQLQKQMYQLYFCLGDVSGKLLFIYTDGLNEAENPAQEQYGDDRLQQMLKEMKSESAKHVIDTLRQTVESHRNGAAPNDDLTMLAVRCLSE